MHRKLKKLPVAAETSNAPSTAQVTWRVPSSLSIDDRQSSPPTPSSIRQSKVKISNDPPTVFNSNNETTVTGGISLLDGEFNEQESDLSFQQALQEWRNAGKSAEKSQFKTASVSSNMTDSSTGTADKVLQSSNNTRIGNNIEKIASAFQFNNGSRSGLSYLERLELAKLKSQVSDVTQASQE